MTHFQQRLYDYLVSRVDNPVSPTYREMAAAIGAASTSTVLKMLDRLESDGWVTRTRGRQSSVRANIINQLEQVPTGALKAELERRGEL